MQYRIPTYKLACCLLKLFRGVYAGTFFLIGLFKHLPQLHDFYPILVCVKGLNLFHESLV
jgi:hypothetical protein